MEADLDRPARAGSWILLGGYLALWAGLVFFLGLLVLSGQLRQAEDAFDAQASAVYREVDTRLEANEFVLDATAAFLRVRGVDDQQALTAYSQSVLERFPHIRWVQVHRRLDSTLLTRADGSGVSPRRLDLEAGRWEPVPPKPAHLATVMVAPARPGSEQWLGLDLDEVGALREAAGACLARNRPTASRLFPAGQVDNLYLLLRPVLEPGQPGYEDFLVSLLVRAEALLPDARLLAPGLEVRLQSVKPDGGAQAWLLASPDKPGPVERLLFPRLELVRVFGSDAQPFSLRVSQQLGWSMIDPRVAIAFVLASMAALAMALAYGRGHMRREDERRRSEQRLYHLANYDSLTGLPNRNLLKDRLQQALSRARRRRTAVALLFLDLDGFKAVNDTAGHEAGDTLLKMVADRLSACLREQDTVARLSGDEFVLLLEDVNGRTDAERVLQQLRDAFIARFDIGEHQFLVSASIGLAMYPDDGEEPHDLLRRADQQMYARKYPEWVARGQRGR